MIQDIDPAAAAKREVPPIAAEFYTEEVPDTEASVGAGHIVYKSVDKVRWWRRGQNLNIQDVPVARLIKGYERGLKNGVEEPIWAVLRSHYDAWKKGQEAPLNGTPLKMWPAISPAQAKTLHGIGIRTVEELMELGDSDAERTGIFGIRNLRARAKAWKAAAQDTGRIAEENIALKEAMEAMKERLADLERGNAELHAAVQQKGAVARKAG